MSDEQQPEELEAGVLSLSDFGGAPAAIHNFGGSPPEVWAKVSYATGPSCKRGEDVIDRPFPLVNWYLHEIIVTKTDNTKHKAVRTVLIDKDGECYGFVSDGVYQSLRLLIAAIGKGPYDPPIDIVVRRQSTKGNRRFYAIEPAPITTQRGKRESK